MINLALRGAKVNKSDPPSRGRPLKVDQRKEAEVIRYFLQWSIISNGGQMPSDDEMANQFDLSERTIRQIRLDHGLDRWGVRRWFKGVSRKGESASKSDGLTINTPLAGIWLLVPMVLGSALDRAVKVLRFPKGCTITAWQLVLTILLWAIGGFSRILHLDDFRHPQSDSGLALFIGRPMLLGDSTVWNYIAMLKESEIRAFYQETSRATIDPKDSESAFRVSIDDHVVPSFTEIKPLPLGKTRVPTRGRSYPAVRLYYFFDLLRERFIGLSIKKAPDRLSRVLLSLIEEVRQLKKRAGFKLHLKIETIFDRGGYRGDVFKELMADRDLDFITLAVATKRNKKQWEGIPESLFSPYASPDGNKKLMVARTTTTITNCPEPIPSIVIRDDTPGTKQRWRVYLTKDTESPVELIDSQYRSRQSHENGYRILKHNLSGDTLPKPYKLECSENSHAEKRKTISTTCSSETMKSTFFIGWVKALAFNMVKDFGYKLGEDYSKMHLATLARKFLRRPGVIHISDTKIQVTINPFTGMEAVEDYIAQINRQRLHIPWLAGLELEIKIKEQKASDVKTLRKMCHRIFANSPPAKAA